MILFGTPVMVFDDVLTDQELKNIKAVCVEVCSTVESKHTFDCSVYSTFHSYDTLSDDRFASLLSRQKELVIKFGRVHQYELIEYVVPVNSWVNRMDNNQYQEHHKHTPCTFSCCFYPIVPEGSAPLTFYNPVQPDAPVDAGHSSLQLTHKVNAVENRLIVFPSWQIHYVSTGTNKEERYSIATNYIPRRQDGISPT